MRHSVRVLPRLSAVVVASCLAVAAGLTLTTPAEASFIGDPTLTTGAGRFAVGGEIDIVFDRDIDFDAGDGDLNTNRFLVTGSYGFLQNWDGFVKLGLFNGELDPGGVDIDPGFAIGVGARGSFVDRGDFRFGALVQFLYFMSDVDTAGSPDIDWFEIDLAPAVSYRGLGQIVPYGGLKLSFVDGEVDTPGGDFDGDDLIGIFGGASFAVTPQFNIGAELRLLDETALGFYARYAF